MSEDTHEQLLTQIKCNPKFTIQTAKSRDVTDLPQLLMFGRNFFDENNHEYFMIC
jgi:hypothetical protein